MSRYLLILVSHSGETVLPGSYPGHGQAYSVLREYERCNPNDTVWIIRERVSS